MRLLSKVDVASVIDRKTENVSVPEWGDDAGVTIQSLTVAEHRAFAKAVKDIDDDAMISAHLCLACVVDDSGSPLFSSNDLAMLAGKSAGAIKRIAKAAMKLNGLGKDAEEERKNG